MHEMALCESILAVLEEQSRKQSYSRVRAVCLEIGRLAGVELSALSFGFEVVMRGSLAEGAALEIVDVPGRAWCMKCAESVELSSRADACPNCGGYQLQVTDGTQMRIRELEVD